MPLFAADMFRFFAAAATPLFHAVSFSNGALFAEAL